MDKIKYFTQSFTLQEVIEIIFSVLAICLALTLAVSGNSISERLTPNPDAFMGSFFIFLITVGPAFILHELGHKFSAMYYGCKAKFKAWLFGLGLMFFLGIVSGFIFAAPGAVYIFSRYLNKRENGIISISGPVVNLVLATLSLIALVALTSMGQTGFWVQAASFGILINGFLAAFNMVPIYPLDGSKVMNWDMKVWAGILIIALGFVFMIGGFESVQFIIFLLIIAYFFRMIMPKNITRVR